MTSLIGGEGDDTINGGSGTDTADFSSLADAMLWLISRASLEPNVGDWSHRGHGAGA